MFKNDAFLSIFISSSTKFIWGVKKPRVYADSKFVEMGSKDDQDKNDWQKHFLKSKICTLFCLSLFTGKLFKPI
jgi:hypothetical protein